MTVPAYLPRPAGPHLDAAHPLAARARFLPAFARSGFGVRDHSPYRHHPTFFGSTASFASWGPCPSLDGITQHLPVLDRPHLRLVTWTISVLFKAANVTGNKTLICKGSGTNRNYGLHLYGNLLYASFTSATNVFQSTPAGTPLVANRWYHGCATWNGTTLRCYQDGLEIATLLPGAGCERPADMLAIGRTGSSPTEYFAGQIDAPIVLAGPLSAATVRNLFTDPFTMLRPHTSKGTAQYLAPTTVYHAGGALADTPGTIYYAF